MINNFLKIRLKQLERQILEIGIFRLIILLLIFVFPVLILSNQYTHTKKNELFLNFISAEYLVLICWAYLFFINYQRQIEFVNFLLPLTNKTDLLKIKIIDNVYILLAFILISTFPYPNFKILFLGIAAYTCFLIIQKRITFNNLSFKFYSTPILELTRFFRKPQNLLILLLFYFLLYKGYFVKNLNLILVFEILIIYTYSSIFLNNEEPLYYFLQYNISFNHFILNKTKQIFKYSAIVFVPIICLLFLNYNTLALSIPLIIFYVLQPILLIVKYACYPNRILNILVQCIYLSFTIYAFLMPYILIVWIPFTLFIIRKATKNFNTIFYVTN